MTFSDFAVDVVSAFSREGGGRSHMEGVHAPQRVGAVFGDGVGDSGASVGTDQFNPGAVPWTQELKEAGDGLLTAVGRGLKQPAGVVVDDDGDVA